MREKILINHDWRFLPEYDETVAPKTKVATYHSAKTERLIWGPGSYHHTDVSESYTKDMEACGEPWQNVNLPHDYIISQAPCEEETCALGYFKYHKAWYRKHFMLKPEDEGKRLAIYFEGITGISDIYLNGCFLKHNDNGYVSFEVDITDLARYDVENVIAVHINPESYETWWYEGGGIYRNVWLVKTDKVAVDLWGVYVPVSKISEKTWQVPAEISLKNVSYEDTAVKISCDILSPDGEKVGGMEACGTAAARDITLFKCETTIDSPQLWDIDSPKQYTLAVKVSRLENGSYIECDTYSQQFGFREIKWDVDNGFLLNGRSVKLKGVCCHLDFGLTGKAVPNNICRYKVSLLKSMGANAFRTSHYPHQEAFMDACDEQGMLVMDENRRFESCDTTMEALRMLVKRDRNRPSVIVWSIGNEEVEYFSIEQGRNILKALVYETHKLDRTRLVTCATTQLDKAKILDNLDVIGVNYSLCAVDAVRQKYPNKPFVGSENCAIGSMRGWYYGDSANSGMIDARDKKTPPESWICGREQTWKFFMERPWFAGTFQWAGIEHRGEAKWPRLCSISGAIDMFLQKKEAYYQNQSHWLEAPMIHLLPHWNHAGMEGMPINVWIYTNCEEAELFLDGVSLGRRSVPKWTHLEWNVPYKPGRLEAVGYNGGKECVRDVQETTGRPVRLHLTLENGPVNANGEDIAFFTCTALDDKGREVPDATPLVKFDCVGAGHVVGTGSWNADHVPVPSLERKMYAGRISVAVKIDATSAAELKLFAFSENLQMAQLIVKAE